MKKLLLLCGTLLVLGGCSTIPHGDWVMIDGSRSDGTILMGVDTPPLFGVYVGSIDHDINQANREADKRCKNWGYTGAEMYNEEYPLQVLYYQASVAGYRLQYQCLSDESEKP